eukprot:4064842-Pleurochrysis_carterae.AAC.1
MLAEINWHRSIHGRSHSEAAKSTSDACDAAEAASKFQYHRIEKPGVYRENSALKLEEQSFVLQQCLKTETLRSQSTARQLGTTGRLVARQRWTGDRRSKLAGSCAAKFMLVCQPQRLQEAQHAD